MHSKVDHTNTIYSIKLIIIVILIVKTTGFLFERLSVAPRPVAFGAAELRRRGPGAPGPAALLSAPRGLGAPARLRPGGAAGEHETSVDRAARSWMMVVVVVVVVYIYNIDRAYIMYILYIYIFHIVVRNELFRSVLKL